MAKAFTGATKPTSIENDEHVEVDGTGAKRVLTSGFDGSALQDLTVDSDGHLQVDILTGAGGTQYADGAVRGTATGTLSMGDDGTNIQSLKCDANGVLQIGDNSGAITVDGTVAITDLNTLATSAKQLADGHNVTVDNSTGAAAVNIQDGGNTITVDGTVAVTNAALTSIDGKITACNTGAVVVSSGAITETNSGSIKTAVELIDNCISGSEAQVDIVGALPAGTALLGKVGIDQVTANANEVVTKTGSVTNATLGAETTKVIGTVNVAASQTIGVTQATAGSLNCTEASASAIKTAVEALDNSVDGNYLNVNLNAAGTDITAGAGAVTAATPRITHASDDPVTTAIQIMDDWDSGDTCKVSIPAHATRVQGKVDNADTTTAREVLAAIASNYVYITSFIISVAAAGNYWLEDGDAAQITPKFYLAANGGVSWTAADHTPYKTTTVNKAVNVKGSAAGAVGVMLTGYSATS